MVYMMIGEEPCKVRLGGGGLGGVVLAGYNTGYSRLMQPHHGLRCWPLHYLHFWPC